MGPRLKKGYNFYLSIEVMKEFKKLCVDRDIAVAHAVEALLVHKLRDVGKLPWPDEEDKPIKE